MPPRAREGSHAGRIVDPGCARLTRLNTGNNGSQSLNEHGHDQYGIDNGATFKDLANLVGHYRGPDERLPTRLVKDIERP